MGSRGVVAGGPWESLVGSPWRVPLSSAPWRSAAYLLSGPVVAFGWLAGVVLLLVAGVLTLPLVVGVVPLRWIPVWTVAMGRVERSRLRLVDRRAAPSPHPRLRGGERRPGERRAGAGWRPDAGGGRGGRWFGEARGLLAEPATWREIGHGLLSCVLTPVNLVGLFLVAAGVLGPLSAPVWHALPGPPSVNPSWQAVVDRPVLAWAAAAGGVLLAAAAAYLVTGAAAAEATLARTLLTPPQDQDLQLRLIEVDRSRARLADAFDSERRRLERDLHDGTQQRLTGLIMTLGLVKLELAGGPRETRELVDRAYLEAQETLSELQDLVRGIHPAILTDRGLATALTEAARRCPVPVTVHAGTHEPGPSGSVESAMYFAGCEALTNLAKHSGAGRAELLLHDEPAGPGRGRVVLEVRDDGVGGADPAAGSGLMGLADRVSAVGGTVSLSSPQGGGTVVRVEVEWTL
ncbi:sensor domain-containing protein [Streptosporangium sp. NPDC000396]|uniref:sensor histidine kinase n=1 Tax=Streptosporangium sp. NPDC000396 TaxID=3366185 RepID=UPI00369306AC